VFKALTLHSSRTPYHNSSFIDDIDTRKFPANHYRIRVADKASFQLDLKLYLVINLFS
jgi:hypothetical protein